MSYDPNPVGLVAHALGAGSTALAAAVGVVAQLPDAHISPQTGSTAIATAIVGLLLGSLTHLVNGIFADRQRARDADTATRLAAIAADARFAAQDKLIFQLQTDARVEKLLSEREALDLIRAKGVADDLGTRRDVAIERLESAPHPETRP